MKLIKHSLEMPRHQITKLKTYKVTEVAQIHMIAFWVTLILSSVFAISYLLLCTI